MPVSVACPKCAKKYQLPDSVLGKTVKCKQCGTAFRTPAPRPVAAGDAPPSSGSLPDEALTRFGLSGNLQRQPDVFGAATAPPAGPGLGNYAGEDPGFGGDSFQLPSTSKKVGKDENPYAAVLNNPAVRAPKKQKVGSPGSEARKDRLAHIKNEVEIQQWGIVYIFFASIQLLMVMAGVILALIGVSFAASLQENADTEMSVGAIGTVILVGGVILGLMAGFELAAGIGMLKLNRFGQIAGAVVSVLWLLSGVLNFVGACFDYSVTFMTFGGWFRLFLILCFIGVAVQILYLLLGPLGRRIFQSDYSTVREQTPAVTHKSYTAASVIGVFLIFVIGPIVLMVLMGGLLAVAS